MDGTATVIEPSAHSCSQRSMRPDVWSGPWPSCPCGSSITTSERWPHLASLEEMYSSITDCAPLTKSPNCASHITSASGLATE